MRPHSSKELTGLILTLQTAKSEDGRVDALSRIGCLAEPAGLPDLLGWIHHENDRIRRAAEAAAAAMLERLTPRLIPAFEGRCRETWTLYYTRDQQFRATTLPGLLLASLDPNGRIRESALHKLSENPSASALPFMLLRLNDWVPVLRRLADNWLARHIHGFTTEELVRVLPILAAMADRRNAAASSLMSSMTLRLSGLDNVPLLVSALNDCDSRTRRFIFLLLGGSGAFADESIQRGLIKSHDPFTAVLFLDALEKTSVPVGRGVLLAAVHARSVMLRNKALQLWQTRKMGGLTAILEERLLDESAATRQFARYWLNQEWPDREFSAFYRAATQNPRPRAVAAALAGYHECGGKLEDEEYAAWLKHPAAIVRRVALKCFAAAIPEKAQIVVRQFALSEADPTLRGVAFQVIQSRRGWLSIDDITSLALNGTGLGLRLKALSLLRREDKWLQLPLLLELLAGSDDPLLSSVFTALRDWKARFNLSWTQPTKQNVADARRWLAAAAQRLSELQLLDLENLLSTVICRDGA